MQKLCNAYLLSHLGCNDRIDSGALYISLQLVTVPASGSHYKWHCIPAVEAGIICTAVSGPTSACLPINDKAHITHKMLSLCM